MIRSNLATRPFYNERLIRLWLLLGLVVVIAATLFNATRIRRYSGTNTELAAQASRDEVREAELRAAAAKLRGTVDIKQIEAASSDARQANELIDRRTFSWTELFNRFEMTLPADARITSVQPSVNAARETTLKVSVVARGVADVNQFMENLDATGAFARLTPAQERVNEEGLVESTLDAVYLPDAAVKTPAATTAPGEAPPATPPAAVAPPSTAPASTAPAGPAAATAPGADAAATPTGPPATTIPAAPPGGRGAIP
jgi:Tfp pilus assembly protein PilN